MKRAMLLGALLLLAAGLVSAACDNGGEKESETPPAGETPATGETPAAGAAVEMRVKDFSFEPAEVDAGAGQAVTVDLENQGGTPHTFTIDELGVDETLEPGQKATASFTPEQGGTFAFYCRFHRAQGMEGTLTVSGGSGGAAPGGTTPSAGGGTSGYGY